MNHVLREYDLIVQGEMTGRQDEQFFLAAESFQALVALIERETEKHDPGNLNPVATYTHFRGRPAMKLSQWVGVLRLADGTTLEILPKTHQLGDDIQACREVLLRMLAVTDERFRVAPPADLNPARMPLFEVFGVRPGRIPTSAAAWRSTCLCHSGRGAGRTARQTQPELPGAPAAQPCPLIACHVRRVSA